MFNNDKYHIELCGKVQFKEQNQLQNNISKNSYVLDQINDELQVKTIEKHN